MNNHYVPKLILRKFSDKLCLYNVKTKELKEDVSVEEAYATTDYYDDKDHSTEKKLNEKIESQFGNFLSNYILKADSEIILRPDKLKLIKKFLLISLMRVYDEKFIEKERNYYVTKKQVSKQYCKINNIEYEEKYDQPPFEEKQIEGETLYQYWLRTLNVILDSDGTPEEILKDPNKTYAAHRWACVVKYAYLAFWDAPKNSKDEFIITDIGMTSENEKGWNEIIGNHKKIDWLTSLLEKTKDENVQESILKVTLQTAYFHENFQMFPISSRRMIVLISPFFKMRRELQKHGHTVPSLEYLTVIPNEELFAPNRNHYELPQEDGLKCSENDRYIYDIKSLNKTEIRYCNSLFLDRIDTYLGFSSLEAAVGSIINYKKLTTEKYDYARNNYGRLYDIIRKRGPWEI